MANCRKQQLNITCGTDVVLYDRLIFDGETFDPNLSVGIAANLVNSLGKRTPLEVEVVDDELLITVPWIDGTLPGYYGLEVTGSCNSKKWSTYADSLIRYTKATVPGQSEVTIESDSYDITQEVGYRYAEGGNITDILVNGSSVVRAGKANITVPTKTSDLTNDSAFQDADQVQQTVDNVIEGNIVTGATVDVDNNTGIPSATVTKVGNVLNFFFRNLKGKMGNSGYSGAAEDLEVVNNLSDGGMGALSAEMGKELRQQMEVLYNSLYRLYTKLANIAFWTEQDQIDAEPTPLSFDVPKVMVSIVNSLSNSVVKDAYGNIITGSTQIDMSSPLTITIEPSQGYIIDNVAATIGGVQQTLTEDDGVYTLELSQVNEAITIAISGSTVAAGSITYALTHLTATTAPSRVVIDGSASIVVEPETNHTLPLTVNVIGATLDSYDNTTGEIEITNVTGDVTIQADAICIDYTLILSAITGSFGSDYYYAFIQTQGSKDKRATILLPRAGLVNSCTWGDYPSGVDSTIIMETYSTIPIPEGTTKIKVKMSNSSYMLSMGLLDTSGVNQKQTAWDAAQSTAREYLTVDYPNATHVGLNIKRENDSTFTGITLSDLGFELTFE